jgi:hypothetical protein
VEIDSGSWAAYLAAWESASGVALDATSARLGYYWATAIVNLQYLPFAAGHAPEKVPEMIRRTLNARDRLVEYGIRWRQPTTTGNSCARNWVQTAF